MMPRHSSGDKRVIFRRDGERYIVFLGDDRIGFVQRTDNGSWNHVDNGAFRLRQEPEREPVSFAPPL